MKVAVVWRCVSAVIGFAYFPLLVILTTTYPTKEKTKCSTSRIWRIFRERAENPETPESFSQLTLSLLLLPVLPLLHCGSFSWQSVFPSRRITNLFAFPRIVFICRSCFFSLLATHVNKQQNNDNRAINDPLLYSLLIFDYITTSLPSNTLFFH